MTVKIPKRRFQFDIEGKLFNATALSMHYLAEASLNPENDTIDAALRDAMPDLTEEDSVLFDATTKERLYREIIKFTFSPAVSKEQRTNMMKMFSMKESEINSLSRESLLQLSSIAEARTPDNSKKKTSSKRSPK